MTILDLDVLELISSGVLMAHDILELIGFNVLRLMG